MAARVGLVGLAFTNASPELPAWGGTAALVGTNPWSIAVPHPGREPVVLDISNAAAGKGVIRHYAAEGRTLPPDWALDRAGRPVTDARDAAEGLLAPMGGYKGYGIAVMVDLLTGGLGGGLVGAAVGSPYAFSHQQGVSHLTMALDPERFGGGASLGRAVEYLDREIHGSPRQPGVHAVYLPGDPEWLRAAARRDGIPLSRDTEEQLRVLSAETGAPFPEPRR
jgi:LDH2 family malate/lactate/ureidoglycolate dehydrogenase